MDPATLKLPTTAAQANAFMTSMSTESKDNVTLPKAEEKDPELVKAEAQDESASGIVPTLQ